MHKELKAPGRAWPVCAPDQESMTYLVALQLKGFTAIVADSRVSWTRENVIQGEDGSLKNGVLFPGCIFGITGDAKEARNFAITFKETITPDAPVGETWERFQKYCREYHYSQSAEFQVVLSSRADGNPRLYVLVSNAGLTELGSPDKPGVHTFGSGKQLLDLIVTRKFLPKLANMHGMMTNTNGWSEEKANSVLPFFICLWLSELSLSFESALLEEHGVGGIFHFVGQGKASERRQTPALYIMCGVDETKKRIWAWIYRVAAVEDGIFVARNDPPEGDKRQTNEQIVYFDSASRLDIQTFSEDDLRVLVARELRNQPFFTFMGVGSAQQEHRRHVAYMYKPDGKQSDLFDKEGYFLPDIHHLIEFHVKGAPDDLDWQKTNREERLKFE